MIRRPPRSTRTDTLFPYTTLFRSIISGRAFKRGQHGAAQTRAAARLHDDEGPQQTIGSSAFYAAIANQTVLLVAPVEMTARRCDVARRQFCFRQRSAERRVGNEQVSTSSSRWLPTPSKQTITHLI